jgi:hypothetical protein
MKKLILALLILPAVAFAETTPCPDLAGNWTCKVGSIDSLFSPRALEWPTASTPDTEGWTMDEKDRSDDGVTYVFGVTHYKNEYQTRVQPYGLTSKQVHSKKEQAYCSSDGRLILTGHGENKVMLGNKTVAVNDQLAQARTTFSSVGHFAVNAEHSIMVATNR